MQSPPLGPTLPSERIPTLDILRGLALFGILASNMRSLNSPLAAYMDHSLMFQGTLDRAVQAVIDVLISQKFVTLFSFLFGIGFAVMMDRARDRGLAQPRFYLRRLTALLFFGLVHITLFWFGDILTPYALFGFILYTFRNRMPRTILIWGFVFYLWPLFVNVLPVAVSLTGVPVPSPDRTTQEQLLRTIQAYSSGSFSDIFAARMEENRVMLMALFFFYPRFLGMFLFGLWVWRKQILLDLPAHAPLFRRCRNIGLAIGLPLNVVAVVLTETFHPDPMGISPVLLLINTCYAAGAPALSLVYVCTVALLCLDRAWFARLAPFAAVGRTALSNYLLQTLVCTTLFYSYGFGLYGRIGPALGLVLTVAIYGVLLWVSNLWLRRYAFGPMEWLWRTLTYGNAPRMIPSAR